MPWYDLFMIAILVFSFVQGARRGLAWQVAPIASLIVGYVVAISSSPEIAPWFGSEEPTNRWIAMLVVYVGISLVIHLVTRIFRESIEQFRMEAFDRHLGSLFGTVKGGLFCLVITFFAVGLSQQSREYVLSTRSGHAAGYVMHRIEPVLPEEIHGWIAPYVAALPDPPTPLPVAEPQWLEPQNEETNDRPRLMTGSKPSPPKRRPSAFQEDSPTPPARPKPAAFLEEVIRMVDKIEESQKRR